MTILFIKRLLGFRILLCKFQLLNLAILLPVFCVIPSFTFAQTSIVEASSKPSIQLAKSVEGTLNITDYLVSEKLDGVRGYWDGQRLLTKSGKQINAPLWFTADFPDVGLEGELWIGRGQFELVSGLVRRKVADDNLWSKVRFMLFDLPQSPLPFEQRYAVLQQLAKQSSSLKVITQISLSSEIELYQHLNRIVSEGAEGLMLHRKLAIYTVGRTDNILKLKLKSDADAIVIGYSEGKGKYKGAMGALKVKMADGVIFEIGSGFTDIQRQHPPQIGSLISFYHIGFTNNGVPRFASFWRVRDDEPLQ